MEKRKEKRNDRDNARAYAPVSVLIASSRISADIFIRASLFHTWKCSPVVNAI